MLKNYFKTAWRNLLKSKAFSAINIFGLATGIAAFMLILNYLHFEYSYEDFNEKRDRLYRVPMEIAEKEMKPQMFAFTYPAVAPALKKDFPEIEEAVRFRKQWGVVKYGNNKFVEDGLIYYVDPGVFRLFSFEVAKGDSKNALSGLNDAVITESTAKKYFGETDPLGKALFYQNENYIVKEVLKDIPDNSHLNFHILLNFEKYIQLAKSFGGDAQKSWTWSDYYTYILLKPQTDVKALQAKLPGFAQRWIGDKMKEKGYMVSFNLQPIKDIHLRSKYDYEMPGNGNLTYLKYLGIAAFFILFIAWINYINLSTARALDRAKEVAVRKVIGAAKRQLIMQFLTESIVVNFLALVLGLAIYYLSLPSFSRLVELNMKSLAIPLPQVMGLVVILFFSGAFLAGAYPSFVLSAQTPLKSLKPAFSGVTKGNNKNLLRRSLVVLQFFTAIMLIAGAIGFYKQLHYMSSADLGFNIRQTLILYQPIGTDSTASSGIASFVQELESHPGIQSVALSTSVPGSEVGGSSNYTTIQSKEEKRCRDFGIDKKFIRDYGLTLMAGRNFSTDRQGKETNIILNETAVKVFGFRSDGDAIGKEIKSNNSIYKIIGVIKDYHQESLQSNFDPIVFYPEQDYNMANFSLKINTSNLKELIGFIKQKWVSAFPESPFSYNFLDDIFNAQYKNDRLFSVVLWMFTFLAIVIASLGLFGLSFYTVAKRNKEISIRMVLGATVFHIVELIGKDYLKLILFAAVAAIPMAYYIMQNWLSGYAFHISLGIWFLITPVILIAGIALSTVLYHSLRAALTNPVKNLRTE
ncbi:MAG TPA: ABC transporter permease [Puia sp.]|nr:ABC transporter permease [Puia sp.]